MIRFEIPGPVRGKARTRSMSGTRKDGSTFQHHYTPDQTVNYEALVKLAAAEAMAGRPPIEGAVSVSILVVYLKSKWTRKEREAAALFLLRPTRTPDCDNIAKSICDGCNKIVYLDDRQVWDLHIRKIYGDRARVLVEFQPL